MNFVKNFDNFLEKDKTFRDTFVVSTKVTNDFFFLSSPTSHFL